MIIRKHSLFGTCALLAIGTAHSPASAQGYCDPVTDDGLELGCAQQIFEDNPIVGAVNQRADVVATLYLPEVLNAYPETAGDYDGIIFDSDWVTSRRDRWLRFSSPLFSFDARHENFANVYIGSTRQDGQQTALDLVALEEASIISSNLAATILFDRLTIENTAVTVKDAIRTNSNGSVQTGQVEFFGLGLNNPVSSGGGLTLRNGSLIFEGGTTFTMAAPSGGDLFIRAESGSNYLRIGRRTVIDRPLSFEINAGAQLTLSASTIKPSMDSNLTVAQGASLLLENGAILILTDGRDSAPSQSTVSGGQVRLEGAGTELRLTAPVISDSEIEVGVAATFRVQQADNASSVLYLNGDNSLSFLSPSARVIGSLVRPDELTLNIGQGTTVISSTESMDAGAGLRAKSIEVDNGTLDITGYSARSDFYNNVSLLDLMNGATLLDRSAFYSGLEVLNVSRSTLRSSSTFGSLTGSGGGVAAVLNDSIIDLVNANASSNIAPGLTSIGIDAQILQFTGSNQVILGVNPHGECVVFDGSCIPGATRYNGQLITYIGGDPSSAFSGFDTVTFTLVALDPAATPADYISGGNNGIYTIARHNFSGDLGGAGIPYDALPKIPTLEELARSGSNLPANLSYVIINDPLQDNQVDITFVERNLANHPDLAAAYTAGETTQIVTEPESGNTSTITISITPNTDGTAMETTNVVVTEPDGDVVSTSSVTVELDKPTGTENTQAAGQLLSNSAKNGSSLPFISHQNLAQQITSFHPEPYSSFLTVGLEQLDLFRNMALDRAGSGGLSVNSRESETQTRKRVWLDTSLVDGNVDGRGNLGDFDYELINFAIGIDLMSRQDARLGVFVGYGHQKMDEHDIAAQDFSADTYHLGAYGQYLSGQWDVRATLAYARGTNETERLTSLGNITSTNRANFNSDSIYAGLKMQYDGFVETEALSISPEVGLGYSYLRQEALVETGATQTALALESATAESIVTSAGLNFGLLPSAKIHPVGFVRFERDWYANNNRAHEIRARLATTPGQPAEVFIGQNRGPDALIAGIGLASSASSGVQLGGGIVYANTTNGEELGGGFSLQVSF